MYTESDKRKKMVITEISILWPHVRHARALPRISTEQVTPSFVVRQAHALSKTDMNETNLQYDTVLQPWQMDSMRRLPAAYH